MPDEQDTPAHSTPQQAVAPKPSPLSIPPGMKPCEYCAEPIREAARKCTHCGSWQSWLGLFGASSTVVSLFVALIAVAGATFPTLVDLFTPENSDLTVTFQSASPRGIAVFATNRGKRPGSVGLVELEERRQDQVFFYPLQIEGVGPFAPTVIPPRDSKLLMLAGMNTTLVLNKRKRPAGCTLVVHLTDFTGKEYESDHELDCGPRQLGAFIKTHDQDTRLLYDKAPK